ncbi:hypothetical protein [Mameliella sp.]|uniref:hypothetical protein n=1 Tax=Mameliella sp. TaxID=1924940 RepID=UPI003B50D800
MMTVTFEFGGQRHHRGSFAAAMVPSAGNAKQQFLPIPTKQTKALPCVRIVARFRERRGLWMATVIGQTSLIPLRQRPAPFHVHRCPDQSRPEKGLRVSHHAPFHENTVAGPDRRLRKTRP